LFYKGSHVI